MATIHADDSEEELKVQCDTSCDKVSKKHIVLGVLGAVTIVAVIYVIIKNNNSNK